MKGKMGERAQQACFAGTVGKRIPPAQGSQLKARARAPPQVCGGWAGRTISVFSVALGPEMATVLRGHTSPPAAFDATPVSAAVGATISSLLLP